MDFDLGGEYPFPDDMNGEMPLYSFDQPPERPPMVMNDIYGHVQPSYPTNLWSWYDEPVQIDMSMQDVMSFNGPVKIDMSMSDMMIFNNPVPDPTVETHGMRPLLPAPRALSACLEDLHHQERLRIQLAQMERERIANIHRRNRARRTLVRSNIRLQRTNSNGSLTSSATSRRRSVPSCHNSVQVPAELNLKLVLQKELRNSDVNNHGRIVIPKRAAEAGLPYLYDKDGIDLCVQDVFTGKHWFMRYRFWPNNASSRMYLLDNTGDYVKKNNLASGDLVALFKDVNQKYYIGCKKMAGLLPPCRPLRMGKGKNELQKIQRELEYLFDSDDGEELPSAASPIKKQFEEILNCINGDKGKSVAIAQTDVAGTSKGNADMSLEAGPVQNGPLCIDEPRASKRNADMSLGAGPVQNGPLCIDEPGASKGNADMSLEAGPVQIGPLCIDEPGASKGNADMSLEAGPVQNGPLCIDEPGASKGNADMSLGAGPVQNGRLCIDEPIINLDDFSVELFEEFHLSDNLLDEFLWE